MQRLAFQVRPASARVSVLLPSPLECFMRMKLFVILVLGVCVLGGCDDGDDSPRDASDTLDTHDMSGDTCSLTATTTATAGALGRSSGGSGAGAAALATSSFSPRSFPSLHANSATEQTASPKSAAFMIHHETNSGSRGQAHAFGR